jgi:hypothetical protein
MHHTWALALLAAGAGRKGWALLAAAGCWLLLLLLLLPVSGCQ